MIGEQTHEQTHRDDQTKLQMAPMIDVVFQLLVFFLFTFKIVTMEGDFDVKMPLGANGQGIIDQTLPLTIHLQSDASGKTSNIIIKYPTADLVLGNDFDLLREEIIAMVGNGPEQQSLADSAEIIFDCDAVLDYGEYIKALTAVSGYFDENNQKVRLVENVKLREQSNF